MAEIVAIVSIFVILPAIIVQAVTTVKKAKYAAMDSKGGDGLRASDLQRLIQEAVEDAVAPLHDRLDELTEARAEPRLDPGVLVYRWEYALRLAEGQMPGVSFPDVFGESSPPRSTDQLKQALVSRLLPGGLDPQSDAQLAELIGQSPSPRRALGLVLGSPPFQQQ